MSKRIAVTICLFGISIFMGSSLWAQKSKWENSTLPQFEDGMDLFHKKLYASAAKEFESVLQIVTDKNSEIYERAEYFRALSNVYLMNSDGETLMLDFIRHYPSSPRVKEGIIETAEYFFLSRRYRQSEDWLSKLDERSLNQKEREDYYFKLGYAQFNQKDYAASKLSFGQILEAEGKNGKTARYYYGHLSYRDSNYVTALKYLEPLKDDADFGPVVPYYLAQIYYKTEEYDKLKEIGVALMKNAHEGRAPEVAKLVGEAHYNHKEYKEAIPYFEFFKNNKGRMRSQDHFQLGFCYYKTKDYENAKGSFNKIVKNKGDLGQQAYYYLGDCYIQTNNPIEAMSAFLAASEMGSDAEIHQTALLNYAKLSYEEANPYESAIDAFNRYLKKYPDSFSKKEVNRYLANLYLTTKDYKNALEALKETGLGTIDLQEAYQKVSYFKGVELYNSAKWDQALNYFEESRKYPINTSFVALSHYWSAEAFYRKKEYEKTLASIASFQNVAGSYNLTEFPTSQYNKGYAYFSLGEFDNSVNAFRLFLDGKSKNQKLKDDAGVRLADSYFMLGNYPQASKYYQRYNKPDNRDGAYANFQLALCYGLLKKNESKIKELHGIIKNYPKSKFAIDAQFEMGETYMRMGENQKALNAFTTFRNNFPNSVLTKSALLNTGVIQRNMEQYKASMTTLKKVVEEYPATPEANEAISFAKLVYSDANMIEEYVDWVESISFANVKKASLDTTVYTAAFDKYSLGEFETAIESFDNYLKRFPEGYYLTEAYFYRAESAVNVKNDGLAAKSYKQVVQLPRNRFTERAIAQLARLSFKEEAYVDAIKYYEQLISFSERIHEFREANIGLLRCHEKLGNHQQTIQYAEIVINDEKVEPEMASNALIYKARAHFALGQMNEAHQAFLVMYKKTKGEPQAEALYHVSYILLQDEKYEESKKTVFDLIDNHPAYARWRYRALLVLAEDYWRLDDEFQANYTLDFIIEDKYDDEVVEKAKALKKQIVEAQAQEEMQMDSTEAEKNELKLDSVQ